jgi:hypothetical protein
MIQKLLTLPAEEGVPPPSIEDPAHTNLAVIDTFCNSRKEGVLIESPIPTCRHDVKLDSIINSHHRLEKETRCRVIAAG